jgi:hypothetical protein
MIDNNRFNILSDMPSITSPGERDQEEVERRKDQSELSDWLEDKNVDLMELVDHLKTKIDILEFRVAQLENPSASEKIGALPALTPSDGLDKTKEMLNYIINYHNLRTLK